MDWCLTGDKALPEPVMARFVDVSMRHRVLMCLTEADREAQLRTSFIQEVTISLGIQFEDRVCKIELRKFGCVEIVSNYIPTSAKHWLFHSLIVLTINTYTDDSVKKKCFINWLWWLIPHCGRDQSRYASGQWETSLQCNDVSHWLGAYLDWSLQWSSKPEGVCNLPEISPPGEVPCCCSVAWLYHQSGEECV